MLEGLNETAELMTSLGEYAGNNHYFGLIWIGSLGQYEEIRAPIKILTLITPTYQNQNRKTKKSHLCEIFQ